MDFTFAEWIGIVAGVVVVAFIIKKVKNSGGSSGGGTGGTGGTGGGNRKLN